MAVLVLRQGIFQSKKISTSETSKIQQSFYDEELLKSYKDEGEEHLFRKIFDTVKAKPENYITHHKIIGLTHTDIDSYPQHLSQQLHILLSRAG